MAFRDCAKSASAVTDEDAAALSDAYDAARTNGLSHADAVNAAVDRALADINAERAQIMSMLPPPKAQPVAPEPPKVEQAPGRVDEPGPDKAGGVSPEATTDEINESLQLSLFEDLDQAAKIRMSDDADIAFAQETGQLLLTNINAEARANGTYSMLGKQINGPEDLAAMAQVWRDPRWETLRYVFVDDSGKVVGQVGVSQRIPGSSAVFPEGINDAVTGAEWINEQMKGVGGTHVWLTHNHPSGNSKPSPADIRFTQNLMARGVAVSGHVVIDSNEYSSIDVSRETPYTTHQVEFFQGVDPLTKQRKGVYKDISGKKVNNPDELAALSETLNTNKGRMQLVGVAPDLTVHAIREVETTTVTMENMVEAEKLIYGFAKETGSGRVMIANASIQQHQPLAELISNGFLLDAVDTDGASTHNSAFRISSTGLVFGKTTREGIEIVAEDETDYQSKQYDEKYAGNINKSKFRRPGVPSILQAAFDQNQGRMNRERRGVVSWAQTEALAHDLGMSVEDLKKRRRGKSFNAEELDRARALTQSSAENVLKAARSGNREVLVKAMAEHVEVQAKYSGAVAEAGRALQILRKQTLELKEVNRIVEDIFKGDPDRAIEMIDTFTETGQVAKFTRDIFQAKASDVLLEIWINALLSGPQTHAVNILSNGLVQGFSVVEDMIAAAGGVFRRQDRVTLRDALARAQGILYGAGDGAKAATRAFRTEEPSDPSTKLEMDRRAIRAETFGLDPLAASGKLVNKIGRTVRIPGRALTAMDEFYKAMSTRGTIAQLAVRQALAKGFKGDALHNEIARLIANPTEEMLKRSKEMAAYTTFTNQLGPLGQSVQNMVAKVPALRLVAPFIRTPTNILKFAIHRSPFAAAFKDSRADLMGKNGKVNRDIAWARVIMGTGIGYMIAQAAMDGIVSGGGPDDRTKKAMKYAQGWQPYSIRHGDTWYSYQRLEPFGMLFGISADFVEIMDQMSNEEVDNVAGLIVGSIAKNLTSKTWLRGVSEFVRMLDDPDRYGGRYVQQLTGTVVPTGLAQISRTQDPTMREARTILDNIRSRVSPGTRRELLPRRDQFGEPITREGGVGPDIISPVNTSTVKNDPVAKEIEELGVSFGRPQRKIEGVELTDEEYDQYATISGTYARNLLQAVVSNQVYRNMPAWARKEYIEKMIRKARQQAKTAFIMQNPSVITQSYSEKLEQMRY